MYKFLILLYFQYVIVNAMIPSLSVRKTDKRLIARKRQDTFEMCRIFTEENDKIKQDAELNNLKNKKGRGLKYPRVKRGVSDLNYAVNPTLNDTDVQRVETIVDKLYDDMEEKGERVNYRQQNIPKTISTNKNLKNATARRFYFAPAELLGPLPTTTQTPIRPDTEIIYGRDVRFPLGIVPYFIDSRTYDADLADVIMKAFDYFEKATCIRLQRLRERPTDKESLINVGWLYITNPSGIRQCVHSNERRKSEGVQMVVFGYDCMSLGDIAHEIMHILGFSHEHTRSDRDQYITIIWDNIKPGYKKYFDVNKNEYQNLIESLPYDYASVLHYPSRAFSKNGQFTILTEPGTKIGQREGLSEMDIEKIGLAYSNECVKRNREYLLKTCPSVVRAETKLKNITQHEIENYFSDRLWPFGIVHYKLRDKMEFSTEERENINAVMRHIEKETCLEFRDISTLKSDVDTEIPIESEHDIDSSNKTDNLAKFKKISPILFNDTNADRNSSSESIPTEHEIKNTETEIKNTESEMKIFENEMKSSKDDIKHSESEIKQSETEFKESENEIKLSENEHGNPEKEINQLESDAKQSENESKKSENQIEYSEKESKNEIASITDNSKPIENNIGSIKEEDDYDQINKKELESNIVKLRPHPDNKGWSSSDQNKAQANTTDSRFSRLRTEKINNFKQNKATKAKKAKQKTKQAKRDRRSVRVPLPLRRHANNILVLTRSSEPGCICPKPGRPNGNKILTINTDCFNSVNDLLHLFVHVLGLDHQHNMHDRDSYLHIVWDKLSQDIKEEMKMTLPPAASVGFPYDYQSVMHYPWLQIKNGVTNIMYPIWNDGWAMGHWQGLSSTDVQKLNLLYFNECVASSQHMNRRFKQ